MHVNEQKDAECLRYQKPEYEKFPLISFCFAYDSNTSLFISLRPCSFSVMLWIYRLNKTCYQKMKFFHTYGQFGYMMICEYFHEQSMSITGY